MNPPPLPKIEGDTDLVLDVYTHGSLRLGQNAVMNEEYGDTDRLAELGHRILDLAVTSHYFFKRPILPAAEVDRLSKEALSDEKLESWLEAYGLRHKLFFAQERPCTPAEIRRFFDTYVGALHIRSGGSIVQDWISRLIDPDAPRPVLQEPTVSDVSISPDQPNWGREFAPMPPSSPPPPLPSDSMSTISVAPPNIVSLALVNQTAVQRGVTIFYSADQVGPPHMPTWTVKCLMNGVEQGRGTGKSQKIAKEEAARQAWSRMGW
ncbi:hypothetical protein C0993_009481 [Termitomyces sp. T159_Od127]|nr:hypothetical protein C0993_009481 [Termitomyces sp. T159_Od127]